MDVVIIDANMMYIFPSYGDSAIHDPVYAPRSEERRVGKECRN